MTDKEGFLEAIRKSPDDLELRMVYADFLEDQGDKEAENVRANAVKCPDHGLPLTFEGHVCPYSYEIHGKEDLCNCCPECERRCAEMCG